MSNKVVFDTVRPWLDEQGFTPGRIAALNDACEALRRGEDMPIVVEGKPAHKLADPAAFFDGVRKVTGPLNLEQVETVNALLKAAAHWPIAWLAYGLATAWHEARLEPIHEKGGRAYLDKYDTGPLAKALGNTPEDDDDGILYAGRGLVQLTGRANYRKAGAHLGLDLLAKPDLALDPENATRILVWGMETGAFTGKALKDYLAGTMVKEAAYAPCRRIINGTDRAALIAGHAIGFQCALSAGGWA